MASAPGPICRSQRELSRSRQEAAAKTGQKNPRIPGVNSGEAAVREAAVLQERAREEKARLLAGPAAAARAGRQVLPRSLLRPSLLFP